MSHSPPGYMDGVPVKISEKYKPPRRVTLPQNLFQRVAISSETVALAHYDFSLENSVINKISEWREAKEKGVLERKERLRLLEEARRNRAEELEAAENEERRKQLTEVSYPSTDDLSEISSEGDNPNSETSPECPLPACDPSPPNTTYQTNSQAYQHGNVSIQAYQSNKVLNQTSNINTNFIAKHLNPATNILTPIISQAANITANNDYATAKVDQNYKYDLTNYQIQDANHSILNKINYSDFENDTSSPFDNMELKTINDLELLAQVLSNTQISHSNTKNNDDSNNCSSQVEQKSTLYYNTNNSTVYNDVIPSHSKYNNVQYNNSNTYYSNKINSYSIPNTTPCNQTSSAYSTVANNVGDCKTSSIGINGYYASGYDYNYTTNQQSFQNYTPTAQVTEYKAPTNPMYTNSQNPSFYSANDKAYNYQSFQYSGNIPITSQTPISRPLTPSSSVSVSQKSKSRSVPDIVKELQDELILVKDNEAKRSQNSSPAPVNIVCPEFSRSNKQVRNKSASDGRSKPQETLLDPYKLLPVRTQRMAYHISQMGFPLPRVARACQVIGENDKKVIEHLLVMDQLMDLGFTESRVSEALLKFNNNRDEALDYLIS